MHAVNTTHQTNIWRIIDSGPADGLQNMSTDEALLASFDPLRSKPILRVYSWNPPALSIGRFQNALKEIALDCCQRDGVPVIRRITGGGALYHTDELTYSIVCSPTQIPPTASVKDSFRVLTGFLLDFYHGLGLHASYAVDVTSKVEKLGERTSFCYAGKEQFDILVNGKKIGGNAQRRLKDVIFQHGSIPRINRTMTGLKYMSGELPFYPDNATSLDECGIHTDIDAMKHALIESFGKQFDVMMQFSGLSDDEESLSKLMLAGKYSTDNWNLRGDSV